MKQLTVHVLDVAQGESAAGLQLTVEKVHGRGGQGGQGAEWRCTTTTGANGRCEPYLLAGEDFSPGHYRLTFFLGDYFSKEGVAQPTPRFLDRVQVDIGVADESIHLPLLITPWSYSVYRGS